MNARKLIVTITILTCLGASYILYTNRGAEWLFWFFLYSVFAQMCLTLAVFTIGAFLSRRSSPKGPELMRGAGISALIIVIFWVTAIAALSIFRSNS